MSSFELRYINGLREDLGRTSESLPLSAIRANISLAAIIANPKALTTLLGANEPGPDTRVKNVRWEHYDYLRSGGEER